MKLKDLIDNIISWFKGLLGTETIETDLLGHVTSVELSFYNAIKDYSIRNIFFHVGGSTLFYAKISDDKENPTRMRISDVEIEDIYADMNIVCNDQYAEVIPLKNVRFALKDFAIDESELVYKITDRGIGLVPIVFGGKVVEPKGIEPEIVK